MKSIATQRNDENLRKIIPKSFQYPKSFNLLITEKINKTSINVAAMTELD